MPLPKRSIEPVFVSRSVYQQDELQSIELETVTNTALTNIIRQLSSLSKHAEDLFGELARNVGSLGDRSNSLQARIDRLSIKVTQLDSSVEEVPLTDITRKKAFKSAKVFDQQIFSRATMPAPMLETYAQCDKPPPLNKLNVYRDDGKDGLKFYTDPNYFFELWRQEMLKDTERVMHDKGKKMHRPKQDGCSGIPGGRGHKKRVRAPNNTREKQRQIAIGHGEMLMSNHVIYRTNNPLGNDETEYGNVDGIDVRPIRPNSIELRSQYPSDHHNDSYGPLMSPNPSNVMNGMGAQYTPVYGIQPEVHEHHQVNFQQQMFDEDLYQQSREIYLQTGQGCMSPEAIYAPGTPSRTKPRPSQPPPAPPSNGSGGGTPNVSNANTPTRGRSLSASRDALPPPPPIPDEFMHATAGSQKITVVNGAGNHIAAQLLGRANNSARAGSPQVTSNEIAHESGVLAQLNETISAFSNMNVMGMQHQMNSLNDLPPPPPLPNQLSPPNSAPPPPPPPPPFIVRGASQQQQMNQILSKPTSNSDIQHAQGNNIVVNSHGQHSIGAKKLLPPFSDSRTDLMKAIRDGITLRKVEKSEQKEIERNTALHDVASILQRRVAIELSDSSESESDDDSEGWTEANETTA